MIIQLSARYIPNHLMLPSSGSYQLLDRGDVVWINSYVLSSRKCTYHKVGRHNLLVIELRAGN